MWIMAQSWHDLLFAHWPVKPADLRRHLPPGLELDLFDGAAWIGVVPFRMTGIRPRGLPPVPGISSFVEINVRTYVTARGRGGVWFFSLDASNEIAVEAARGWFHLPYFNAVMECRRRGDEIAYASRRTHRGAAKAEFRGRYRPTSTASRTRPGTLEHWLTERYSLFATYRGALVRADVSHDPWPLQAAHADIELNTMADAVAPLPSTAPLLHFAKRLDVTVTAPQRLIAP